MQDNRDNVLRFYNILDTVGDYTLALNACSLVVFIFIFWKNKPFKTSFAVIVFLGCLTDVIHQILEFLVQAQFCSECSSIYKDDVRFLWYMQFAYTDAVYVITCSYLMWKFSLYRDKASKGVLFSYLLLGLTQVFRYYDKTSVGVEFLGNWLSEDFTVYSLLISSLNVMISFIILAYVFRVSWIAYRLREV